MLAKIIELQQQIDDIKYGDDVEFRETKMKLEGQLAGWVQQLSDMIENLKE
jgi:hypothetical protein